MYGAYVTTRWSRRKQPVYIRRMDGVVQRYHKWTTIEDEKEERGRYEFYGTGRDRYEAIRIATKNPPDGYVEVDALEYIRNYCDYSVDGVWVWYEIES
jgi:hypothetical protein